MKKLLIIFAAMFIYPVFAYNLSPTDDAIFMNKCIKEIENSSANDITNYLTKQYGDNIVYDEDGNIDKRKSVTNVINFALTEPDFTAFLAGQVMQTCDLLDIIGVAKRVNKNPSLTYTIEASINMQGGIGNKKIVMKNVLIKDLLDRIAMPMGFMIMKKDVLSPMLTSGDLLEMSDTPDGYFFPKSCSDHFIAFNLSDNAPVNRAGQAVFGSGNNEEYFLDFPNSKSVRAFPGLLLRDIYKSMDIEIVVYTNIFDALKKAEELQKQLQNTPCAGQGLAVYLVSLSAASSINMGDGADVVSGIAYSVSGGALAVSTGIAIHSLTTGTLTVASVAGAIPGAGWWVAGIALAVGGVASFYPWNVDNDLDRVGILAGPYDL